MAIAERQRTGADQDAGARFKATAQEPKFSKTSLLGTVLLTVFCASGLGVSARACVGATPLSAPDFAPAVISLPAGLPAGTVWTLQGAIDDLGAANSRGVSVTNAVFLRVN